MRITSDLLRIAQLTSSTEETRYYLKGVLVEPMPVGAILVSTDGHRMTVLRDWNATFAPGESAAIVRLSADALKACKATNKESRRIVEIDQGAKRALVVSETDKTSSDGFTEIRREELAISAACIIDGTFPAWRHVLPKPGAAIAHESFATHYVAAFGMIGEALAKAAHIASDAAAIHGRKAKAAKPNLTPAMQILAAEKGAPALVRWFGLDDAFGVLMPIRGFSDPTVELPAWIAAQGATAAAA